MKATLICFLMAIAIVLVAQFKIFDLIASNGAFWFAVGLVVIVFIVGVFILGNPFAKGKSNEDK